MVVRLTSKWDMRRLAKSIGATVLPRLSAPTPDEMGFCEAVKGEGSIIFVITFKKLKILMEDIDIICTLESQLSFRYICSVTDLSRLKIMAKIVTPSKSRGNR